MGVTAVVVVAVYVFISIYPDYFSTKLPVLHNIARYKYTRYRYSKSNNNDQSR